MPSKAGPSSSSSKSKSDEIPSGPAAHATATELAVVMKYYPPNPEPPLPSLFSKGYPRNVYPYNHRESQTAKSEQLQMRVVRLANEFIEVDILPDLGGHIWGAKDLKSGHEMFHRTDAIKHQDLAVAGPWIATGIEFNFPVTHSLLTVSKINETHGVEADGSAWSKFGATDKLFGVQWQMTIRLRPGKRVIEIDGWLHNPTDLEHPYCYWGNAGITTDDSLRLYYPYTYCEHHGGKLFKWPHDNGADLSYWKACKQPISAFGDTGTKRFFGGYYEKQKFGVVHTADPKTLPGKKYFAWGNGKAGERWGKLLSENLRDYVELQSGTRNDQEFWSVIAPHSTIAFHERWQPIDGLGGITDANEVLTVYVGQEKGKAIIRAQSVEPLKNVKFRAYTAKGDLDKWEADLAPDKVYTKKLDVKGPIEVDIDPGLPDMKLTTCDFELFDYGTPPQTREELHDPSEVSAANFRINARNAAQIFCWKDAWTWYEAALKLAPDDNSLKEEVGLFRLYRHETAEAKKLLLDVYESGGHSKALTWGLLRIAVSGKDAKLEERMLLGLHGEEKKLATALARLAHRDFAGAVKACEGEPAATLIRNRDLGVAALVARRLAGRPDGVLLAALAAEYPIDPVLCFERHDGSFEKLMQSDADVAISVADVYLKYGDPAFALKAVEAKAAFRNAWQVSDLALADYCSGLAGKPGKFLDRGVAFDPLAERPWQDAFFAALPAAAHAHPKDARVHYLLGNLLQRCGRTEEARAAWTKSTQNGGDWPVLHLSLALSASSSGACSDADVDRLSKIVDGIHNTKIDTYYFDVLQRTGRRECLLKEYAEHLKRPDCSEYMTRRYTCELTAHGRYTDALDFMLNTKHLATHGGHKLTASHIRCRVALARRHMKEKRYDEARKELKEATVIQHNFSEDTQTLQILAEVYCLLGDIDSAEGHAAKAKEWYAKAANEFHDLGAYLRIWQARGQIKSGINPSDGERSLARIDKLITQRLSLNFDDHAHWHYLRSVLLELHGDEAGAQRERDKAFRCGLDGYIW